MVVVVKLYFKQVKKLFLLTLTYMLVVYVMPMNSAQVDQIKEIQELTELCEKKRRDLEMRISTLSRDLKYLLADVENKRKEIGELREGLKHLPKYRRKNLADSILEILKSDPMPRTLLDICLIAGLENKAVSQALQTLCNKLEVFRILKPGQKRGAKYVLTPKDSTVPHNLGKVHNSHTGKVEFDLYTRKLVYNLNKNMMLVDFNNRTVYDPNTGKIYDPETGELVFDPSKGELAFDRDTGKVHDSNTGKLLLNPNNTKVVFDPQTGKAYDSNTGELKFNPRASMVNKSNIGKAVFDPKTGKLLVSPYTGRPYDSDIPSTSKSDHSEPFKRILDNNAHDSGNNNESPLAG